MIKKGDTPGKTGITQQAEGEGGLPPEVLQSVGAYLRQWRWRKSLSLRALGELSGVSFQTIARIEKGENFFSLQNLWRIAVALKVPPGAFLQPERQGGYVPAVAETTGAIWKERIFFTGDEVLPVPCPPHRQFSNLEAFFLSNGGCAIGAPLEEAEALEDKDLCIVLRRKRREENLSLRQYRSHKALQADARTAGLYGLGEALRQEDLKSTLEAAKNRSVEELGDEATGALINGGTSATKQTSAIDVLRESLQHSPGVLIDVEMTAAPSDEMVELLGEEVRRIWIVVYTIQKHK